MPAAGPEAAHILKSLRQKGIQALYHFTSVENFPTLREAGAICSKQTLERLHLWPPPKPGGNQLSWELDRYNDNWDKVSLSFTPYTPMAYLKKPEHHLCFLIIDPVVASWEGVWFTDSNGTKTGDQKRGQGMQGLNLVNFDAIRGRPKPWDKDGWVRPVQAEVLVPDCVPLGQVTQVAFISKASLREGDRLWGQGAHPPFVVNGDVFRDLKDYRMQLTCPHVTDAYLTSDEVSKDNCGQTRGHKRVFVNGLDGSVTLVVRVQANAGSRATVRWSGDLGADVTEFDTTAGYYHWARKDIALFPAGRQTVEYFINDARWCLLEFQVKANE